MEGRDSSGPGGIEEEEVHRALSERDLSFLIEALGDSNSMVRVAALLALGELGGRRAEQAVLSVARDRLGERPEVRVAALEALGMIYDRGRYASLLEGFITGDSRKVMQASRKMLKAVDPAGHPASLARSGALDHSAINVYGSAREESAIPLLVAFIEERKQKNDVASAVFWGKVYAAVKALGRIGGDEAERTLDSLANWIDSRARSLEAPMKLERLRKIEAAARGRNRI